jgi:hypothetical protein
VSPIAICRLLASALLLASAPAAFAQPAAPNADARLEQSRVLASELGSRLKAALTEAMTRNGPAAAIGVCADVAPQLATELSRRSGAQVGRTSERNRNPQNAPAPWARAPLERFAAALAAGEPAANLEYFAVEGGEARFLRPIVTEGLCLACHGSALAPEVQAALAARYPDDLATGFSAGELRGAFVVTWPAATPR